MRPRTTRLPLYAAGLTAILAAALAGCAAASSGTSATGPGTTSAAGSSPASAVDAVKLAAKTTSGANSFTAAMSLQATGKSGSAENVSMTASMAEQLRPSLVAEVRIGTLSAAGQSLPGGLTELVTPSTLYLQWSFLTQELHTGKPWLAIPVSDLSNGSGVNLGQIFSQATSNSPLNESQLLAGASDVQRVGTGTVDGVRVTEYRGTVSIEKGMQYLSGSAKTALRQQITAAGLTTATFTVWIDSSQVMRKAVITERGTALTEVITIAITSLNQPVNVQVPAADQTSTLPGGALGSLG